MWSHNGPPPFLFLLPLRGHCTASGAAVDVRRVV
jgi:hypothetical protein